MGYGVFIHRADSRYEDTATQYQFPKRYLTRVAQCVGDWIVYYEPTKVPGSRGYYAMAKVTGIAPDRSADRMHLALIDPKSYLQFANPVPFNMEDGVAETGLITAAGGLSGDKQSAVRVVSSHDFWRIVSRGLADEQPLLPRVGLPDAPLEMKLQFDEEQVPFTYEQERERIERLTSRVVRDRVFRRVVLRAYDERCAVTGLKLINGGGRAEVAAAHIRPVEHSGPDIVNNGVALSGTAHWMFDRGLIGFTDEFEIIVSRHVNDRDGVAGLINRTGRLLGPLAARDRPHPAFLNWHRENRFKH